MLFNKLIPFGFVLATTATSVTDVIARNPNTSTLNNLLQQQPEVFSSLESAKNITVLAPSNAAFEAFLKSDEGANAIHKSDLVANLLTYHVLNGVYKASAFSQFPKFPRTLLTNSSYTSLKDGQRVKVQAANDSVVITSGSLATSRVVTPDLLASNGVIHIIDSVLVIPASISDTAKSAHLDSLAGALKKADLVDTVDDLSSATVFAPTDDAFSAASDSISKLDKSQLKEVLTYHVVDKVQYSIDLADGSDLKNINGDDIHIDTDYDSINVNSANVVISDVLVSNGVVHVIDEVLAVNSNKKGKTHDHKHDHDDHDDHDNHDHDHHDHDHDHHSSAGSIVKISRHGVIALGIYILAQLFAI